MIKKISINSDPGPLKEEFAIQLEYLKNQFIHYLKENNYASVISPKCVVNGFISFLLSHTDVTSVNQLNSCHILNFKNHLISNNISYPTYLSKLKTFIKFLMELKLLHSNPFSGIVINHRKERILRGSDSLWEPLPDSELKSELSTLKTEFVNYLYSQGLAKRTIEGYDGQLNYFFFFLLTRRQLSKIVNLTKETIRNYQTHLCTRAEYKEKLLSLTIQRRRLMPVRKFSEFLLELEYISIDAAKVIKFPKEPETLPKGILSLKQISKLLASHDLKTPMGLRNKAMLEVLYCSAIRNEELRHLKLKDINLDKCEIYVEKGKGSKSRIVPMGKICGSFVEEYIKKARPYFTRFKPDEPYLFVSRRGKQLSGVDVCKLVKNYCIKAGIKEKITPHSLRHTCATHLLKNNAPLRYIQTILGHSSIESTQIYTKVEISDLQKVHARCHPRGKK